ncbi:hypothetical protein ABN034_33450 [Actinopolymorpha sp. B11F2]|uniref:hypothetical protein n=1 Tax=Actinopolymorpha sp. B11F2 TaxID=3160862 RepID=UPI0032E3F77E
MLDPGITPVADAIGLERVGDPLQHREGGHGPVCRAVLLVQPLRHLATLSCPWWIPTQFPDLNAGFLSLNLGWELVLGVYVWHLAWSLALGFFFNPQD